jgi:hypothetical protein
VGPAGNGQDHGISKLMLAQTMLCIVGEVPTPPNRRRCWSMSTCFGKADLREVMERAQERRKLYGMRTILFVKDVLETLIDNVKDQNPSFAGIIPAC